MGKMFDRDFFIQDVQIVAKALLGCRLVKKEGKHVVASIISETEAYDGEQDLACHASGGKTKRNSTMYKAGGVWYVYLCYGMHWMLNVVTGPADYPASVLIRATKEFAGPGKLTKGMGLDGACNGKQVNATTSSLWLEGSEMVPVNISSGPRIGVNYAGKEWAQKPYRFWFS